MNKVFKNGIVLLFLLLSFHITAFSEEAGHISGVLLLDDSWNRRIYLSFVETFEKEYSISNNLVIASADIDSIGNFQIRLNKVPRDWSLLRLHIVKKGVSPNSLVIGSTDENYFFLIARRGSEIELYNDTDKPIFKNTRIEGAPFMSSFQHIRKLAIYPNAIDYENSVIEKEFIKDVVSEKLKLLADSCQNPLVSLYALYQTDFQSDYYQDPAFYDNYLLKWKNESSTYFESFRLKFPEVQNISSGQNFHPKYIIIFTISGVIVLIGLLSFNKRGPKIETLSIQERKIFGLLQEGLSNKEISAECNISLSTVKSHVGSIYSKLNIKSRREAINVKFK